MPNLKFKYLMLSFIYVAVCTRQGPSISSQMSLVMLWDMTVICQGQFSMAYLSSLGKLFFFFLKKGKKKKTSFLLPNLISDCYFLLYLVYGASSLPNGTGSLYLQAIRFKESVSICDKKITFGTVRNGCLQSRRGEAPKFPQKSVDTCMKMC